MNLPTQKHKGKAVNREKAKLTIYEMTLFAMFGALMLASKVLMEALPNIHLLGMFVILLTVTYRKKALIAIYLYVFLNGLISGFAMWWIPYLYIWAILWGVTMLLPKNMPRKAATIVYPIVGGLFGLSFGALYAPAQAIMFNLSFKQTIAWIIAGLPFDVTHAVGNFAACFLVVPFSELLKKLKKACLRQQK